jgi:hypothetical protein
MADHGVLGDVSNTLSALLTDALASLLPAPPPVARVHDLLGTIPTDPPSLTVFLYEISEDPSAKNRPPRRTSAPPNVSVRRAPLALVLRYMLTPWSGDRLTDQQILGRAMQALHDNAILSGPQLRGGLIGTADSLKISLSPITLEERTRIWHAVEKPYRISATYNVRVVSIDSEVEALLTPVAERVLDAAVPEPAP